MTLDHDGMVRPRPAPLSRRAGAKASRLRPRLIYVDDADWDAMHQAAGDVGAAIYATAVLGIEGDRLRRGHQDDDQDVGA